MATYHGKNGVAKVSTNQIAEVTQFTVTETAETADDTSMGDSARTHLLGHTSASGSLTCHWDPSDTNGQVALTAGASVTLNLYPSGDSEGDLEITGTATITSVGVQSQLDGVVSQSFDFQVNGALTKQAVSGS